MKKIRAGKQTVKTNKNGSKSIMERTSKSTWKTVQKVKPVKGK